MNYKSLRLRVRFWWWRFTRTINDNLPMMCGRCGKWKATKDTRQVQHTSGLFVRVCTACHRELYGEHGHG